MSAPIPTVFIVDDDISVRESLEALIHAEGWRAEAFASGHDFLTRPRLHGPSCLLLDLALPGLDGLALQQRLAAERTEMPIIIITGHGDVVMTVRAMKAGAVEFLMKPLAGEAVLRAVREAVERSHEVLQREAQTRELRERYDSLSVREREVMALVVAGLLNKQVGGRLGISEITVKAHRGRVMRKMRASSLPDLVTMAASLRLTPAPAALLRELRPSAIRSYVSPLTSLIHHPNVNANASTPAWRNSISKSRSVIGRRCRIS
jgi:FixJ family two-component response regulator